jgi:hypothetical protein
VTGDRRAAVFSSRPELPDPRSIVAYRDVSSESFLGRVREREPITLTRWGDGEWSCVIPELAGTRPHNSDGHRFFPELGAELRGLLLARPAYMLGMAPHVLSSFGERIGAFLAEHELHDLDWVDARPFHRASMDGKLDPFIHTLSQTPLLVVGPSHLEAVARTLRATAFVEVPAENCYLQLDRIHAECERILLGMPPRTFVSISAGMPANLLVDRLHRTFDEQHLLVDIGSLWDPYAGVLSRNYMKRLGPLRLPDVPGSGLEVSDL